MMNNEPDVLVGHLRRIEGLGRTLSELAFLSKNADVGGDLEPSVSVCGEIITESAVRCDEIIGEAFGILLDFYSGESLSEKVARGLETVKAGAFLRQGALDRVDELLLEIEDVLKEVPTLQEQKIALAELREQLQHEEFGHHEQKDGALGKTVAGNTEDS